MNKSIVSIVGAAALAISSFASAAANGFYVGGQVGQSWANYGLASAGLTSATSIDKKGFAGRISGGYQFDENWSAELGYTNFAEAQFNGMNGTGVNGKLDHHAWDITGKGTLPFNNNWAAYGKLGLARTTAKPDASLMATSTVFTSNKTKNTFVWGAGASYEANDNLVVDASWTRTQNRGVINNLSLLAVGLTYHFG